MEKVPAPWLSGAMDMLQICGNCFSSGLKMIALHTFGVAVDSNNTSSLCYKHHNLIFVGNIL